MPSNNSTFRLDVELVSFNGTRIGLIKRSLRRYRANDVINLAFASSVRRFEPMTLLRGELIDLMPRVLSLTRQDARADHRSNASDGAVRSYLVGRAASRANVATHPR